MAGTITVGGSATTPTGSKVIGPLTITGTAVIGQIADVALVQGDNQIPIPAGSKAVVIQPPPGNTAVLKVRTVSGDTGSTVSKTDVMVLPFDQANLPAILYINASAAVSGFEEFSFI